MVYKKLKTVKLLENFIELVIYDLEKKRIKTQKSKARVAFLDFLLYDM